MTHHVLGGESLATDAACVGLEASDGQPCLLASHEESLTGVLLEYFCIALHLSDAIVFLRGTHKLFHELFEVLSVYTQDLHE